MAAARAQADMTSIERVNPCCASTRPLDSNSNVSLTRASSMNRLSGSSTHVSPAVLIGDLTVCPSCERFRGAHHLDTQQPNVRARLGDGDEDEVIAPRGTNAAPFGVEAQECHGTASRRTARESRLPMQRCGKRRDRLGVYPDLRVRFD